MSEITPGPDDEPAAGHGAEPAVRSAQEPDAPAAAPGERFEVILDEPEPAPGPAGSAEPAAAGSAAARIAQVSALDLDRLPDRDHVRLLVDAEQLDRLRAAGLPVRVRRSVPIAPLDPALIPGDDEVAGWLAERLGPADSSGREG